MYYFNVFGFNEFLKFFIIIILSLVTLIIYLNTNELKIIKKILHNFISK